MCCADACTLQLQLGRLGRNCIGCFLTKPTGAASQTLMSSRPTKGHGYGNSVLFRINFDTGCGTIWTKGSHKFLTSRSSCACRNKDHEARAEINEYMENCAKRWQTREGRYQFKRQRILPDVRDEEVQRNDDVSMRDS